jgi:hypothetical protein
MLIEHADRLRAAISQRPRKRAAFDHVLGEIHLSKQTSVARKASISLNLVDRNANKFLLFGQPAPPARNAQRQRHAFDQFAFASQHVGRLLTVEMSVDCRQPARGGDVSSR